jgi:hypothetical protein
MRSLPCVDKSVWPNDAHFRTQIGGGCVDIGQARGSKRAVPRAHAGAGLWRIAAASYVSANMQLAFALGLD